MSLEKTNKLKWFNFIDCVYGVMGIAKIKKGFSANLHNHKEKEVYFFLYGTGLLYIDGYISSIQSPKKINIDSNKYHAMTPISDYVILLYYFPQSGPFKTIKYKYLTSKL